MEDRRTKIFTAYIDYDPESELYIGTVPWLSGGHSQAKTLEELQANLREVCQLVVEDHRARGEAIEEDPFVGTQQVVVEA